MAIAVVVAVTVAVVMRVLQVVRLRVVPGFPKAVG